MNKVAFGGGCHWCTEAVFQSLIGVLEVEQGWLASDGEFNEYSEGVVVHYNEKLMSLSVLVDIHLHTHSCTSTHQLRGKYRSAVYVYRDDQLRSVQKLIEDLQSDFDKNIITKVLPMMRFKKNKEEYLDYYYKNPEQKFCKRYINPKLKFLLENYTNQVDDSKLVSSTE